MSVYTTLTLQQVQQFAVQYNLDVQEITPIQAGIENTNYFVKLSSGQELVLTLFEEISHQEAQILPPVLQHLAQAGIPVAAPLVAENGEVILTLANKPAQLAPRLQGSNPIFPTVLQVSQMGETLAHMHLALQHYDLKRQGNHGQVWWQQTAATLRAQMSEGDQALLDQLFAKFEVAQTQYPDRPLGLIHGDLFRDNTLYGDQHLTGVLDFSELSNDELLLDIAICLNDFCSQWPTVSMSQEKAQAFMQAYHQVRPLTADEQQLLPVYLAMAAGRFWLSRLQVAMRNQTEGRTGEHVLQKDPQEMRQMVLDRLTHVVQVNYAL